MLKRHLILSFDVLCTIKRPSRGEHPAMLESLSRRHRSGRYQPPARWIGQWWQPPALRRRPSNLPRPSRTWKKVRLGTRRRPARRAAGSGRSARPTSTAWANRRAASCRERTSPPRAPAARRPNAAQCTARTFEHQVSIDCRIDTISVNKYVDKCRWTNCVKINTSTYRVCAQVRHLSGDRRRRGQKSRNGLAVALRNRENLELKLNTQNIIVFKIINIGGCKNV